MVCIWARETGLQIVKGSGVDLGFRDDRQSAVLASIIWCV